MPRNPNTTKDGYTWTEETKRKVWLKGSLIPGYDENIFRRDRCGTAMKWSDHGNRNSEYGWEIDHMTPVANNGGDELFNLQPLNWKNNVSKGDKLIWNN